MMGITPFDSKPKQIAGVHKQDLLTSLLPSPNIMKALGVFIPKAMSLNNREHLDKDLVPKDSTIRHLFEEDDNKPPGFFGGNAQNKTHISQHNIKTPVGNIQISSISKSF
jgi:hypothetical protein